MTEDILMNWLRMPLGIPEELLSGDLSLYQQAITHPDSLFKQLRTDIPWQPGYVQLYGKEHRIPRLQCWMADAGIDYRYSGRQLNETPWQPDVQQLKNALNHALGTHFNSVLCNLYRNGQDRMGWHADNEPELGKAPIIASVTLGTSRDLAIRPAGATRQQGTLQLDHGSLLIMQAGMQDRWQHAVPARKGVSGARINLTFRQIHADNGITPSSATRPHSLRNH